MLARLSIRDIVLIDRLDIDFASGLSVLTGETGAGKSILLDAFALALGARGDATLVRQGAEQGQVTAMFELPAEPSGARAAERERHRRRRAADPAPRAVRRRPHPRLRQRPAGRACRRCKASARRWSKSTASTTPARWSMPATHRRLLDAYGRLEDDAAAVERLWAARREAEDAVASHRAEVERAAREAEWLRHAVEELGKLAPAGRRGNRAGGTARRHDAGGEGRRRSARCPRGGGGHGVAGAGAVGRGAAAGAPRRAGARPGRAGGEGARCRAQRARRGARPSRTCACASPTTIRRNWSGSRSGCSRCAPPAASTIRRSMR